jgi:hypothetical protein
VTSIRSLMTKKPCQRQLLDLHPHPITLWCFYIVGREILTLGEGFNTQVITLWCFYIVVRGQQRPTNTQTHRAHTRHTDR